MSEVAEQTNTPDPIETLYNSVQNTPTHNIEMESPKTETSQTPQSTPPQAKEEFELDWNGQKIKADREKFTKWAQMGYDYNQKIGAVSQREKQLQEDYNRRIQEYEQRLGPYKEIDAYAIKNPQWWNSIQQSYQQQTKPEIPPELKTYLDPIVNDYTQVKSFIQEYQNGITERNMREQDTKLDEQIKSLGAKYNLDLSAKDANGQSLEQRVLAYAIQNKIPTFKAAFLDYYHEDLQKQAEARGRESVQKEIEKRKKAGLLSETSTPASKDGLPTLNVKGNRGYLTADQILKRMGG